MERWTITGLRMRQMENGRTVGSWVTNDLKGRDLDEGESVEVIPLSLLSALAEEFEKRANKERQTASSAVRKDDRMDALARTKAHTHDAARVRSLIEGQS